MITELPDADKEHPDPRDEYVDGPLDVANWEIPGQPRPDVDTPPGAPSWWKGDEDASQSFFKRVGINPHDMT
jgi:hypothetical protein